MSTRLPAEFLASLQDVAGFDEEGFVDVHERGKQVVSVRVNPAKFKEDPLTVFNGATSIPWCSNGYYLPARPSFTLDPLLHAGNYYVQEASSMFIEQCIKQHADTSLPHMVLDLCAAPGGKSTLIQSLISEDSLLVSNEVIKTRVPVLSENVIKWGAVNNVITNNDPHDFQRLPGFFDMMVIDAPCSGSGLFRRDVDAIDEWSTGNVEMCSLRQQRILTDALPALKNNGLLVYSTCSYSRQENEDICDWLMDAFDLQSLPMVVKTEWNIVQSESNKHHAAGYRFYPDKLQGEGFFVACFRKISGGEQDEPRGKKRISKASRQQAEAAEKWLSHSSEYDIYQHIEDLFAFPRILETQLSIIHSNLYVKRAGTRLGKEIKGALVPDHELAVSQAINDSLPSILLNRDEALQYLRKEEVTVSNVPKGWQLVRYNHAKLGWVKALGNRINNYYPKEWRILKSGNN